MTSRTPHLALTEANLNRFERTARGRPTMSSALVLALIAALRTVRAERDGIHRIVAGRNLDDHEKVKVLALARALGEYGNPAPLSLVATYAGCDADEVEAILGDYAARFDHDPPVIFERVEVAGD